MMELFDKAATWIASNPEVAGLMVFMVAFTESLVLVGLLIPGATLMFAAGALVGTGSLELWPTMAWAVAGAVAGDGLSFWLGWYYRDRLRSKWPFSQHADWLERGETFFHRHGNMSIILGRFVGPVRPIIPAVAGMMGMKPLRFTLVNVTSALLWAPAYLLPGVAFGSSLALAGQVAGRLALLLVGLLLVLWLAFWLVRRLYRALTPRAAALAARLLAWGRTHPLLGRLTNALLNPEIPPPQALLVFALLLLGGAWLVLALTIYAGLYEQLKRIDENVLHLFSALRTPWGDHLMVFLSQLGDAVVISSVTAVTLALIAWQRRWREMRYWLAALAFTAVEFLFLQRIGSLNGEIPHEPMVQSVIVYGFLGVFLAQELQPQRRWLPYAWAVLLVCAIALARLYLGAIRLSDLLGDLGLGGAWVILLGIAYHRHLKVRRAIPHLPLTLLLTLAAASGWHTVFSHEEALRRHTLQTTVQTLPLAAWWREGWRELPAYRIDLGGDFEQPLNVQWAGQIEAIQVRLRDRGWRAPPPLTFASALYWLLPDTPLHELPVLPQLHEGHHESLLLVQPLTETRQLVLRLWPADVELAPGKIPLWIGTVALLEARRIGFFTLPATSVEFDEPMRRLERDLDMLPQRLQQRPLAVPDHLRWQGQVLLLKGPHEIGASRGQVLRKTGARSPSRG